MPGAIGFTFYVFHPYSLVKRSSYRSQETGNVERVMNGEIDDFVEAFLEESNFFEKE